MNQALTSTISAFIIDDDEPSIRITEFLLLKYCPEIEIIGKFSSPKEAIHSSSNCIPDLVFSDIRMDEMNGIDLAREFNSLGIRTIFITSYDRYALEALKIGAEDFLLKPIDAHELIETVRRAKHRPSREKRDEQIGKVIASHLKSIGKQKHLALPTLTEVTIADTNEIIYCEGVGNYTHIYFKNDPRVVLSKTLAIVEEHLDKTQFARAHNKYIVNINCISKYIRRNGNGVLVTIDGKNIPISKSKRKDFFSKVDIL